MICAWKKCVCSSLIYLLALGADQILEAVSHHLPLDDVNQHGLNVLQMCLFVFFTKIREIVKKFHLHLYFVFINTRAIKEHL